MEKAKDKGMYEKLAPILVVLVIGLVFVVASLWQKVTLLESGNALPANLPAADGQANPSLPVSGKLTADQASKIPEINNSDHKLGANNPEVYILEYSDYECPFCSRFHPTTKQALDEYGDKVALVYRHFPLDSLHPKARPAAVASECISKLGGATAFWKFTDIVFEDQTKLSDIPALATAAGVNRQAFDNCVSSKETDTLVEEQYQGGIGAGVTGTPGNFVVNSKGEVWTLPGAVPYTDLKKAIDEALAS
ncbi:DsbA family protein [Candidatus Microgenomates bacterium]|nr:MAG: DsbA family protein [Candidatus Microgenomates bacterium]